MKSMRFWFCRNRGQVLRGSLLLTALAPLAAWTISESFGVDARSVIIVIASLLFAVWRPYRDSWLRPACTLPERACESH